MLDINEAKNFVENNLFKKIEKKDFNSKGKENKLIAKISTSQIRKFLSAVNKINNKINYQNNDDILSEDIVAEIDYMRIQFAYLVGRNKSLKELHEKLDDAIANINKNKNEFIHSVNDTLIDLQSFEVIKDCLNKLIDGLKVDLLRAEDSENFKLANIISDDLEEDTLKRNLGEYKNADIDKIYGVLKKIELKNIVFFRGVK